jgi:hypothetical protein
MILIVDGEEDPFVMELQRLIQEAGARTLLARDATLAIAYARWMNLTGAVVNARHEGGAHHLGLPLLLYDRSEVKDDAFALFSRAVKQFGGAIA